MTGTRRKPRRGRPPTGHAVPAAERMRRLRMRRKAEGFRSFTTWVHESAPGQRPYSPHRLHDARNLAIHALIVQRIGKDPSLLQIARANLERWSHQRNGRLPPALAEWRAILTKPWLEIASVLTEQSEQAIRLRQSTPFAGVLKPADRKRILDALRD